MDNIYLYNGILKGTPSEEVSGSHCLEWVQKWTYTSLLVDLWTINPSICAAILCPAVCAFVIMNKVACVTKLSITP